MKTTTNTVFHCDYCKKKLFREHAMRRHEARCYKNPENFRACFGCDHLEMKDVNVFINDNPMGGEIRRDIKLCHCIYFETFLIPPKAEHKGNAYELGDDSNEPMPKYCLKRNVNIGKVI